MTLRPAKTQISLGNRPVWSESSLCAQWLVKDPSFLHADNEDSDQNGRMPRLIWVFAGRTAILLVLSCCGSNLLSPLVDSCFPVRSHLTYFIEGILPNATSFLEIIMGRKSSVNVPWNHSFTRGLLKNHLTLSTVELLGGYLLIIKG